MPLVNGIYSYPAEPLEKQQRPDIEDLWRRAHDVHGERHIVILSRDELQALLDWTLGLERAVADAGPARWD